MIAFSLSLSVFPFSSFCAVFPKLLAVTLPCLTLPAHLLWCRVPNWATLFFKPLVHPLWKLSVYCLPGQMWRGGGKDGEAALVLLTSGNLKPACQDKFIHCYLFHVDILQLCKARNSCTETCLKIPLASSWSYSLFIYQLLKKGKKVNQERICMSQAEEKLYLSSTKEFSLSKLCRKYGFKIYPVSPPLRTEDLEGFSVSLCALQCFWTQLFELIDWVQWVLWVSYQFWYIYFAFFMPNKFKEW